MYYNLNLFGQELRRFRKRLNKTQKDISDVTGINQNTLRRIENGRVLPKQETLDLLSTVYKQDVTQLFLACRMDLFEEYTRLMDEVEKAFEASSPEALKNCLDHLHQVLQSDMNQYYKDSLRQMTYLLQGSIIALENKTAHLETAYQEAKHFFLTGLEFSLPDFSYANFKHHLYNKLELQLLMSLAVVETFLHNTADSLALLDHCASLISRDSELSKTILATKIYLNASYMHYLNHNYEQALKYADQAIENNIANRSQYAMGHLFARKGFAELKLDQPQARQSFKKALFYHDMMGQPELKQLIITILKDKHGMDLTADQ